MTGPRGRARLSIVGLGYGSGEQMTLLGHRLLTGSRWIGHLGLSRTLARCLLAFDAVGVDLDMLVGSQMQPFGFTERAARAAVQAAATFGNAAVALSGHPSFGNPFATVAAVLARQAGVDLTVTAAPSGIDCYAEWPGIDVLRPGTLMVDARDVLASRYSLDRRFSLALWNAGYLSQDALRRLSGLVGTVWGRDSSLVLYRAGNPMTPDRASCHRVVDTEKWGGLVDYETLIVVPARVDAEKDA